MSLTCSSSVVSTVLFLTVLALPAQDPGGRPGAAAVALPKLTTLGPVPVGMPAVSVAADGSVHRDPATAEQVERLLRVDRAADAAAVAGVLSELQQQGVLCVHFAAMLPDGSPGCFSLALPAAAEVVPTLEMRLHRARPGVPARSAVPLLQRMRRGFVDAPCVVRVDAPAKAPFQQVLAAFAALQEAGVPAAVLRSREEAGGAAAAVNPDAAFAIDLGPQLLVSVSARALPQARPEVAATAVGCLLAAPQGLVEEAGGGAGGRYGGRAGGGGRRGPAESVAAALHWLGSQQGADGGFVDARGQDVTATALVMLTILGNGETMIGGPHEGTLRRGIGWLVDRQRDDGTFGDPDAGSTRRDALATYALAEAYGLSRCLPLRGAVADALAALGQTVGKDGGCADGSPGAASDAASTALVACAIASAGFFRLDLPVRPADMAAWFTAVDGDPQASQEATAAALFARLFAGMDPKEVPAMRAGADRLLDTAGIEDPWAAYWTTYALFQIGGRHWNTWQKKLDAVIAEQSTEGAREGSWPAGEGLTVVSTTSLRLLTLQAYYRYSRLVR